MDYSEFDIIVIQMQWLSKKLLSQDKLISINDLSVTRTCLRLKIRPLRKLMWNYNEKKYTTLSSVLKELIEEVAKT